MSIFARYMTAIHRSTSKFRQCGKSVRQWAITKQNKIGLAGCYRLAAFSFVPVVHAAWGFGKKDALPEAVVVKKSAIEQVIEQADGLYARNEISELYDLLDGHRDCGYDELLWRLARAAHDKGKMETDKEEAKKLMYEAFDLVKKALLLNEENFATHKWYAILLDVVGEYEGTKQRLSYAFQVRDHFLRAIELNPKDATTIHCLGYWCFLFADLPWIQQKVASVLFTTPPSSTYQEALKYFIEAEKVDPDFYSMNLLMLGKTYLRLNEKEAARDYLTRARNYPVSTEDDKKAHKEAVDLLKQL